MYPNRPWIMPVSMELEKSLQQDYWNNSTMRCRIQKLWKELGKWWPVLKGPKCKEEMIGDMDVILILWWPYWLRLNLRFWKYLWSLDLSFMDCEVKCVQSCINIENDVCLIKLMLMISSRILIVRAMTYLNLKGLRNLKKIVNKFESIFPQPTEGNPKCKEWNEIGYEIVKVFPFNFVNVYLGNVVTERFKVVMKGMR